MGLEQPSVLIGDEVAQPPTQDSDESLETSLSDKGKLKQTKEIISDGECESLSVQAPELSKPESSITDMAEHKDFQTSIVQNAADAI